MTDRGKERWWTSALVLRLCRRASGIAAAAATALQIGAGFVQAAAPACHPAPARATSVQGSVETRRAGKSQWHAVKLNDTFCPGDVIRVLEHSRADVMLFDQSVLRLNANASITVQAPKERRTGVIDLLRGAVHFFARGPNSLDVNTPFTVAGVRGTEFLVTVEPKRTLLTVFEGTVVAQNRFGSLTLRNGQSATAEAGKAPALRIVLHPRDAVQWTLYYPPVVYFRPGEVRTGARLHAYRAQRLLAVGSVDEAHAEIARALQLSPNDADALSLQAVMTLVQGEKDRAFEIAKRAVNVAPSSATARIALSYTQQARFDLVGARASVQRAVALKPRNALAWARLAELDSSFGELGKATAAAQRAVKLQPELSLTQTVLGFAQLTSIDIRQAEKTFEKAIALDQADPLPRLGLGLARIRGGNLNAGGRELEIAASLDPGNSLVRSYLGKAYYEEKRTPRAEREYGVAEKLDPKDPTPWFYGAIAKETTNRPVEALQDLEKAQKLNDNRAVYRSKLLLDSDAAARAVSQARIYSELGFQGLALAEGWQAVNRDPTSFSAHRFLADSYGALPRHEIARVSELLQSQLLSPVTNTPLQPRLGESNLFLVSSAGPGIPSFNEFNALFNRDGVSILVNGMGGSKDSSAGEVVVAGIVGKAGYSIGASKFRTDGFGRVNSDQKERLANAFFQYDFSPSTSAQYEYRHRNSQRGDLALRFFPTAFYPGLRTEVDSETHRIGLRHAFSPGSVVLASVMKQNRFTAQPDLQPIPPVLSAERSGPDDAVSTELQHIYRSSRFTLTSGLGYFDIEGRIDQSSSLLFPGIPQICVPGPFPNCFIFFRPPVPPGIVTSSTSTPTDIRHTNAYVYANYGLSSALTLTAGLSQDSVNGSSVSVGTQHQTNPKLGLVWRPAPGTTVRAAAFRTFKRTLITDQTLEPTQIAGFNQFYDDVNATDAWRYGIGVDQKFGRDVFGGVELSMRKLDSPYNVGLTRLEERIDEYHGRVYGYWAPRSWLALGSEYHYEKWDSEGKTGRPTKLTTQRVPLSVNVFNPSGWGGSVVATYYDQRGMFSQGPGSATFWIVDLALKYRLPNRYGFLSVGVRNAGDKQFNYYDLDTNNPQILPTRMAFVQLTLALP